MLSRLNNAACVCENRCKSYTQDQLLSAVKEVKFRKTSKRKASKTFGVPRTTLVRHLKAQPGNHKNTVFTASVEKHLVKYLRKIGDVGELNNWTDVRKAIYLFASSMEMRSRNDFRIPRSWARNLEASMDWLSGFRKRHPDLAINFGAKFFFRDKSHQVLMNCARCSICYVTRDVEFLFCLSCRRWSCHGCFWLGWCWDCELIDTDVVSDLDGSV